MYIYSSYCWDMETRVHLERDLTPRHLQLRGYNIITSFIRTFIVYRELVKLRISL